jgi:hypothetical protein
VLAVLGLWSAPLEMWVVDSYMLLELLEGIVGPLGHAIHAMVHVPVGNVAVGEQRGGGDGVVGRKPVKRIGKHLDRDRKR